MLSYIGKIENDPEKIDGEGKPECGRVAPLVYGCAAKYDTKSHADVPACENRRVGCAALVVRREIDEHGLESWPYMSVAKSYDDGSSIESYGVLQSCEKEVAEDADKDAVIDIIHHPALAQRASSDKTGEYESCLLYTSPSPRDS